MFIHMYKIRLDSGNACHVGLSCTLIHIYNNLGVQSGVKRFGLSGFCRISDAEIAHCLVVPLTSKAVHLHRGHVELAKLYRSAGSVQAASGCIRLHQAAWACIRLHQAAMMCSWAFSARASCQVSLLWRQSMGNARSLHMTWYDMLSASICFFVTLHTLWWDIWDSKANRCSCRSFSWRACFSIHSESNLKSDLSRAWQSSTSIMTLREARTHRDLLWGHRWMWWASFLIFFCMFYIFASICKRCVCRSMYSYMQRTGPDTGRIHAEVQYWGCSASTWAVRSIFGNKRNSHKHLSLISVFCLICFD